MFRAHGAWSVGVGLRSFRFKMLPAWLNDTPFRRKDWGLWFVVCGWILVRSFTGFSGCEPRKKSGPRQDGQKMAMVGRFVLIGMLHCLTLRFDPPRRCQMHSVCAGGRWFLDPAHPAGLTGPMRSCDPAVSGWEDASRGSLPRPPGPVRHSGPGASRCTRCRCVSKRGTKPDSRWSRCAGTPPPSRRQRRRLPASPQGAKGGSTGATTFTL